MTGKHPIVAGLRQRGFPPAPENETDEPSYTQPVLYSKIKAHPSTRVVYTERLLRNGTLTQKEADAFEEEFKAKLEGMLAATKALPAPQLNGDPLAEQRIMTGDRRSSDRISLMPSRSF